MDNTQKQKFIEEELYHELRCLLGAATLWKIYKKEDRGFDVVVAMDSALLHARCLFNFFCEIGGNVYCTPGFGPVVKVRCNYGNIETAAYSGI